MAELLGRGYNVAVPSVDIGDDVYVVEDREGNLIRVQVKSSICRDQRGGFTGQARMKIAQLKESKKTRLIYVFALRYKKKWNYLVIGKDQLEEQAFLKDAGYKSGKYISFTFHYRLSMRKWLCGASWDVTPYANWDTEFPRQI